MNIRLMLVCVMVLNIISSAACNGQATIDVGDVLEDLLYADLVVEGEVCGISKIIVPHGDFLPSAPHGPDLPFAEICFKVKSVLVGDWQEEFVPLIGLISYTEGYHFDLEEGRRYILALRLHHGGGGIFATTRYILKQDSARFLLEKDTFTRGCKKRPMQKGMLGDLYAAIRKINERRSVEYMSKEAEVIVRGIIEDVRESYETSYSGEEYQLQNVTLAVKSVLKGDIDEDVLAIKMILKGQYNPVWRTKVPEMNRGEEWYAFLKCNDNIGYYPFAGVNGLFRVEGDMLIRDNHNTIYLKYDPASFENEIFKSIQE